MKTVSGTNTHMQVVDRNHRRKGRPTMPGCCIVAAIVPCLALLLTGCPSAGGGGSSTAPDDTGGGDDGTAPAGVDAAAREIEEADIVKLQDGFFYLANRYRGLRIIDATNIDRLTVAGGLEMSGRGVELFVDDGLAFVVTSADFFSCGGEPVSFEDAQLSEALLMPDYSGSRLTVADVSDPRAPFEISHFDMDGFITATRRVGNIIYAAGNFEGFSSGLPDDDGPGDASTDGLDDPLPLPPSVTGLAATVDDAGQAVASAQSPAGSLGEFRVSAAGPGEFVQVTVSDGNTRDDWTGVVDQTGLPLTVGIAGDLTEGAFAATLVIQVDSNVVNQFGTSLDNLAIYRYDEELGVWIAQVENRVGAANPGGELGDTGFFVADGGTVFGIWAVVETMGDYLVGRRLISPIIVAIEEVQGGTVSLLPERDSYQYLDEVTLIAQADEGFQFAGWGDLPPAATEASNNSLDLLLLESVLLTPSFQRLDAGDAQEQVFVVSIDISDPENIRIVDRVDVVGESLDIQVTTEAIYLLGPDPTMSDTTRVTYIDISDPNGDVVERDTFRVPGLIENRFFADHYNGTFRIITEELAPSLTSVVALYVYDVTDPDDVRRIARLGIETGESLRSVRFDGDRGYAVTFRQVDPLFVLDLSDPFNPAVTGELTVPGWSTHLVPLGDRLVGVGFDDTAGFRPAVALYDVSNPARPRQVVRIVLGERWTFDTTSEATVDEKALKVLEDQELILMPFSSFDADRAQFVDSLQLIDLTSTLRERGFVEHRGLVRRAGVIDGRLWILSDEALQVADMDDRDAVASLDTVDIISEQELLDAGITDCVDSARFDGFPVGLFLFDDVFFGDVVILTPGPCGSLGWIALLLPAVPLAITAAGRRRRRR